ncbi:hypothetical protein [Legionella fairfieldensis]|uniref:hypothetical protein n=1 Tax=Legionella fairfieldensis TaxID=45064 RepID=UPI00048DBD9F|nr:hypothetical protein [Legionella fairfieldensis]
MLFFNEKNNENQSNRNLLLNVPMENYLFIPKNKHSENIKGFFSHGVWDCVCGFISGKNGYAFFHFYKKNDPDCILNLIKKDFESDPELRITLIGGSLSNAFNPWKEKNRHVSAEDWNNNYAQLTGNDAINWIRKTEINPDSSYFHPERKNRHKLEKIVQECIIELDNGFIEYDYKKLDLMLKDLNLTVRGFGGAASFNVRGIKDLVGYQNMGRLLRAFSESRIVSKENISHYHCVPGYDVVVNFNKGDELLTTYQEQPLGTLDTGEEKYDVLISDEIGALGLSIVRLEEASVSEYTSLNSQDLIPKFKK